MRYVLVGKKNKRYDYFLKECEKQDVKLIFYDIDELINIYDKNSALNNYIMQGDIVKIDPIDNKSIYLSDLSINIGKYKEILIGLSKLENINFLNDPLAILNTLDKKYCKNILEIKNISTTRSIDFSGNNFYDLIDCINGKRISQIFIKPNFGSGASGVVALKYNRKLNKCIIQTSIQKYDSKYINTKKIRHISDMKEIKDIVNFVINMGCIVEMWLAKDSIDSIVYDLRVLYQFSDIAYIQARGSKNTAITNLHLNNMPIDLSRLNISDDMISDIYSLCSKAIGQFKGLKSVGFDILIEKNSKKAYIIEMNSQGDLMYKDIYAENSIYKKQVEMMMNKWQEK